MVGCRRGRVSTAVDGVLRSEQPPRDLEEIAVNTLSEGPSSALVVIEAQVDHVREQGAPVV